MSTTENVRFNEKKNSSFWEEFMADLFTIVTPSGTGFFSTYNINSLT